MLIALIIILLLAANTVLAGEGADAFRFGLTKFSDFSRLANDIITTSAMISFIVIESHRLNDEPRQPTAKKQLSLTKRLGRTLIGAFAIALLLIFFIGDPFKGLLISQMILSIQLPFTVFLQVGLTSSRKVMGQYVNSKWSTFVLYTIAAVVTVLNIMLLVSELTS